MLPEPAAVRAVVGRGPDSGASTGGTRSRRIGGCAERGLYDALEPDADPEIREALEQAATVLDIGRSIDFFDRHEHVAEIVLATDLTASPIAGSHSSRPSCAARATTTGGRSPTRPSWRGDDGEQVLRAAVILALADDIEERCPPGAEVHLDCRIRKDEVALTVPELAGWRERKIGPRFGKAFGRKLIVASRTR